MNDPMKLLRTALAALGFQEDFLVIGGSFFAVCNTCAALVHLIPGETDGSKQPIARHSEWHEGPDWNLNPVDCDTAAASARADLKWLVRDFEEKHGPISVEAVKSAMAMWPDADYPKRECCASRAMQHHQPTCPERRCRCGEPFSFIGKNGTAVHNGCKAGPFA